MRLAVFRAEADGCRTAARLAERGHEAVLAPVIRIVPTGVSAGLGRAGAVVFTSQHAVESYRSSDRQPLQALPCFCVGSRTAAAARKAGFDMVRTGDGDAEALATMIVAQCPSGARITFVAGRDRKPGLEAALAARDFAVSVVEAYSADPVDVWPPDLVDALARCEGALHYSARTAKLACLRCEAAGLTSHVHAWIHFCLSADVAASLQARGVSIVRTASRPQEAALLALL